MATFCGTAATFDANQHTMITLKNDPADFNNIKKYNLFEMGVSKEMEIVNEENSDTFCSRYLETFKELDSGVVELKVDKNYSQFEFLPELHCTMVQHPDVAIVRKCDQLTLLPVEVHSSPFSYSINKCVLGVIDLLRLHRAHDRDVSRCCGFVFPKLPGVKLKNKQCVVMVQVKWENLTFLCSFISFRDISSAEYAIATELSKAIKKSPRPGSPLKEMEKYMSSGYQLKT